MTHRCPPPWPAGSAPTALEVLQVLDSATTPWCDPCRIRYIDHVTDYAGRGGQCEMSDHAAYPLQVCGLQVALYDARRHHRAALTRNGGRYRAAWLSARRRARRAYAAGHLAGRQAAFHNLTAQLDAREARP